MLTHLLTTTTLLALSSAFSVRYTNSQKCSGTGTSIIANASSGCIGAGSLSSMNIHWIDEADNPLIVAAYSDDKCCHSAEVGMFDWSEACQETSAKSFRVLDPSKPNEGKKNDVYEC